MRPLILLFFTAFFLLNCKQAPSGIREGGKSVAINSVEVSKKDLVLNQIEGKWFVNGKREGVARRWSENGVLRVESTYHQNKLVGVYKSWWENGVLAEESNYVNGLKQGEEKQWYATGQLSKIRQLVEGKEEGLQKAWLPNGPLYVNYEAKNGRIFGMLRANSCYKLEDEVVVRD